LRLNIAANYLSIAQHHDNISLNPPSPPPII